MRPEIEQAVALLRRGDETGLEEALALLQKTVFSFSMRVCGQREDAEDTMQEVLLKSVPYLARFNSPQALSVWLYKVAKNRCLMSRRKSKFAFAQELSLEELMPLEDLSGHSRIDPEALAIRGEKASRLREAIQRLPAPYRIVLVLRDMEGLTDDEVAEITGLRPGTVRVRLHRARLFVRKELMRAWRPRKVQTTSTAAHSEAVPRPARCKEMFAQLSNYLDDQLDGSLCEELEKHMGGCEPCKVFLASLEATIERCRKAPAECPASQQATMLRKRLMRNYKRAVATLASQS